MNAASPVSAFAPPLVSTLAFFLVFAYLYGQHRERYLGLWTIAWGLWLVRLTYAAFVEGLQFGQGAHVPRFLAIGYTTFVLMGAAEYGRRRVPGVWLTAAAVALLLRTVGVSTGQAWIVDRVLYIAVLGAGWVWAGLLFTRTDPRIGAARWVPATALVLMGIHQWSIPLVQANPTYEPWALVTTLALQIGIGVGVLLVFERRGRMLLEATHEELAQALTKALAGYIPICAHCKSIRDEDNQWHRLEAFLSTRTAASLSHGLCDVCAREHYPEIFGPDSD